MSSYSTTVWKVKNKGADSRVGATWCHLNGGCLLSLMQGFVVCRLPGFLLLAVENS
jgi:hypothetical protein